MQALLRKVLSRIGQSLSIAFTSSGQNWLTEAYRLAHLPSFGTILNANGENPKVIQELMRHANLKVTMDTYVQAVTDEKREAQNKLVKMILPGIQRAVI
jgi:integrase